LKGLSISKTVGTLGGRDHYLTEKKESTTFAKRIQLSIGRRSSRREVFPTGSFSRKDDPEKGRNEKKGSKLLALLKGKEPSIQKKEPHASVAGRGQ